MVLDEGMRKGRHALTDKVEKPDLLQRFVEYLRPYMQRRMAKVCMRRGHERVIVSNDGGVWLGSKVIAPDDKVQCGRCGVELEI